MVRATTGPPPEPLAALTVIFSWWVVVHDVLRCATWTGCCGSRWAGLSRSTDTVSVLPPKSILKILGTLFYNMEWALVWPLQRCAMGVTPDENVFAYSGGHSGSEALGLTVAGSGDRRKLVDQFTEVW